MITPPPASEPITRRDARAIDRIRNYYIENAGEARNYFLLTGYDDHHGVMANMGLSPGGGWQLYLTAAGAVFAFVALAGHLRFQAITHAAGGGDTDVLFPTPSSQQVL